MAKNLIFLVIFCSSSYFLSLDVRGDRIFNKTTTAMAKKSKRDIGMKSENSAELNEFPFKDDFRCFKSFVKRAPSGFTGMRGKKKFSFYNYGPNSIDLSTEEDYSDNDILYKKLSSRVQGVPGRMLNTIGCQTSLLNRLISRIYLKKYYPGNKSEHKLNTPVPSNDYFGIEELEENTFKKRTPSGFTGMRGKRQQGLFFEYKKRFPTAFLGVRGKRDFKRLTSEQFQPEYLGFRNKFVGVRGKKDSNSQKLHKFELQILGLPINNCTPFTKFLIQYPEFMLIKQAPSGFLDMHGKRQAKSDFRKETFSNVKQV